MASVSVLNHLYVLLQRISASLPERSMPDDDLE